MIAALTGKVTRFGYSQVYLQISNGIEYEISVPLEVLYQLQKQSEGACISLYIYHHFKENEQNLFGFIELQQREFFRALLDLRGFGTSLALSLLSHLSANEFIELCRNKDTQSLCRIPRIGKSTAESLIFEVNRQHKKWDKFFLSPIQKQSQEGFSSQQEMALQALVQLGYKEKQTEEVLRTLIKQRQKDSLSIDIGAAEWIRGALRIL